MPNQWGASRGISFPYLKSYLRYSTRESNRVKSPASCINQIKPKWCKTVSGTYVAFHHDYSFHIKITSLYTMKLCELGQSTWVICRIRHLYSCACSVRICSIFTIDYQWPITICCTCYHYSREYKLAFTTSIIKSLLFGDCGRCLSISS